MTDYTKVRNVLPSGHAVRNYSPDHFRTILREAEGESTPSEREEIRATVREALRRLDGGRFYPMLDAAHAVLGHSDLTGQDNFARMFPRLVDWVSVFGEAEDLATFDDLRGRYQHRAPRVEWLEYMAAGEGPDVVFRQKTNAPAQQFKVTVEEVTDA